MVKRIPLHELCQERIYTLPSQYQGQIEYVDISSVDNSIKEIVSSQLLDAKDAPSRAKQLIKYGDILVSTVRPNLNGVAFVDKKSSILLVASTGYCVLRCKNEADRRYVFYFCQSPYFVEAMSSQVSGANYPAVSSKVVKNSLIPVLQENEKEKMVSILDKVFDLISLRKQQLAKLDELVKSRFIEMFGDPLTNPKGWPVHQLSDYIEFLTSGSRGWAKHFSDKGEYFITIKNVKNCRITLDDVQHIIAPKNAEAIRTKVQEDDLLISITADLGRTGVITKEIAEHGAYINQHLTCIRLNKNVLKPLFVAYYMESEAGKTQFRTKNQSAVKAGLNFHSINTLNVIVPPIELQSDYLSFVEQTDKSKFGILKSLDGLGTLKKILMQHYFG